MKSTATILLASLATSVAAVPVFPRDNNRLWNVSTSEGPGTTVAAAAAGKRTFSVLHFVSQGGKFSTEGTMDPVVSPGGPSAHSHGIMGGSNFDLTIEGDQLLDSACTNAKIKNDKSNYWVPQVFFQSPSTGQFKQVPLYYMNVYYFIDATNDEVKSFPPGLKIVSGDASTREAPSSGSGALQLDPSKGDIQAVQWTCPTQGDPDRYPQGSDGSMAGIADPSNRGAGAGFPAINCDGTYSPLRQDIHLPSCYNPAAGLDDYKTNMQFPTTGSDGMLDCPEGWVHLPHLFYEVYYDTQQFTSEWTPDGQNQPFVLANGDRTGFSSHADFVAGWDEATLQTIIDTCDAGTLGMENCPDIPGGVNTNDACTIESHYPNPELGTWMDALPGDNPLKGWGV